MKPSPRIGILGVSAALPSKKVSNAELAARLKVSQDWIVQRTGIKTRYFAGSGETTSSLALSSASSLLKAKRIQKSDIALIVGATTSSESFFPSLAAKVQAGLNIQESVAYDLGASSCGFLMGLHQACQALSANAKTKYALVTAAAVQSPFIDWGNANLAVILGDAAASVLVGKVPAPYGILASSSVCHAEWVEAAKLDRNGTIQMDGVVMGREYLKEQPELIFQTLQKAKIKLSDIDLFLFHQANLRLIQLLMQKLKLPMEKTFTSVETLGNTSEASIPCTLAHALRAKRLKRGMKVVLSSVGAGCTLSVIVLRWY